MSQIFELFGFTLDDSSEHALYHRKTCTCPFTCKECDGGGNRYQSFIQTIALKDLPLYSSFSTRSTPIPAGICSLKTTNHVWIVCPRRLFVLDKGGDCTEHEVFSIDIVKKYKVPSILGRCGVWSELKVKYLESSEADEDNLSRSFDYTFDYIICPTRPKPLDQVSVELGMSSKRLQSQLERNGFTLANRIHKTFIEDYPYGPPLIVEVMTSSTSGGNKARGTTIQHAFIQALMGNIHEAPGINYRQVWARMVSQLIVKSQIGKAWNGRTIWVIQDALANYISSTTNLNLHKLVSDVLREVNVLSLKFSQKKLRSGVLGLEIDNLYSGAIPAIQDDTDFNKLLQAASIPAFSTIIPKLLNKTPRTFITV